MPIVVSDTSPIRALDHLGMLALIQKYYGEVLVPPIVAQELRSKRHGLKAIDVNAFSYIKVVAPKANLNVIAPGLDPGEAEAIQLALEVQADYLLIDEAAGRDVASQLGIKIVGTLGILPRAKEAGEVHAIRPLIDRLESELRFFINPQLRRFVLATAHEE